MKMSRRTVKVLATLLVVLMCALTLSTVVFAGGTDYMDPKSITPNDETGVAGQAQTIAGSILSVAQVIGVSVAVIMLIVLAIKYISAAPNDKAEIKKHAVVYIVGAVVLFGASGLLQILKNWAEMFQTTNA